MAELYLADNRRERLSPPLQIGFVNKIGRFDPFARSAMTAIWRIAVAHWVVFAPLKSRQAAPRLNDRSSRIARADSCVRPTVVFAFVACRPLTGRHPRKQRRTTQSRGWENRECAVPATFALGVAWIFVAGS